MSEKPGKRLVGWSTYLLSVCKRTALWGCAGFSVCFGAPFLLLVVVALIRFPKQCPSG